MIESAAASSDLLPLVWAGFLGLSITFYVLLDGFSLGIGILFPFAKNKQHRDLMMASVAPVWDGNQTWLVGGGMALLTAFPKAFNLLLTIFYLPLSFMLIALIFRGLAFEFRFKTKRQRFWDIGFPLGSIVAAFCQGLVLGNYVQGFELSANADQLFFSAGYLLNPFALFTGLAVVVAYAMLGSCWLVWKTEDDPTEDDSPEDYQQGSSQDGELQEAPLLAQSWARRIALRLLPVIATLVIAVSLLTPWIDGDIAERWFTSPNLFYLSPIPIWTTACLAVMWFGLRNPKREALPFWGCIGVYLLVLGGLAVSLFPWIVPRHFNLWDIAAPEASLSFALIGVLLIVPIIIMYTGHAYYVFRGKVSMDDVYH